MIIILAADAPTGGGKLKVGATYRERSQFQRYYSIMAVSKKQ